MHDYTWQSIYFSYLLFVILMGGAIFFFVRSLKDGYLGANSEEPKFRMLHDDDEADANFTGGAKAPRRSQ